MRHWYTPRKAQFPSPFGCKRHTTGMGCLRLRCLLGHPLLRGFPRCLFLRRLFSHPLLLNAPGFRQRGWGLAAVAVAARAGMLQGVQDWEPAGEAGSRALQPQHQWRGRPPLTCPPRPSECESQPPARVTMAQATCRTRHSVCPGALAKCSVGGESKVQAKLHPHMQHIGRQARDLSSPSRSLTSSLPRLSAAVYGVVASVRLFLRRIFGHPLLLNAPGFLRLRCQLCLSRLRGFPRCLQLCRLPSQALRDFLRCWDRGK